MRWMKESALDQIRIVLIFECVPIQFELREFVDITMIVDMNNFYPQKDKKERLAELRKQSTEMKQGVYHHQ